MFLFLRYAYIYLQLCAHYDAKNQVQIRKNRQQSLKFHRLSGDTSKFVIFIIYFIFLCI